MRQKKFAKLNLYVLTFYTNKQIKLYMFWTAVRYFSLVILMQAETHYSTNHCQQTR